MNLKTGQWKLNKLKHKGKKEWKTQQIKQKQNRASKSYGTIKPNGWIQISNTDLRLPKGKRGGRDKSGAWDEHTHTIIYKIDNQQGHAV